MKQSPDLPSGLYMNILILKSALGPVDLPEPVDSEHDRILLSSSNSNSSNSTDWT